MGSKQLTILDVSTLLPGPFTSFLLNKHLNVHVEKIEDINHSDPLAHMRPTKDGIGLGYMAINKNKHITKLDFRKDGIEIIKRKAQSSDIFIENYKPGKAFRLGLGFEDLQQVNPHIIYCSLTGFGPSHPLAKKSAHDLNILALSGFLDQQQKMRSASFLPPLLLADLFTAYQSAIKILSCLISNSRGIHLEISMYEAFQEAMILNNYPQLTTQADFNAIDYIMSGMYPCYGLYQARDGWVAVAAIEKPLWIDFCHHLDRQPWIDQQFDMTLTKDIALVMRQFDRGHWEQENLDFCVSPVLSVTEAQQRQYV